MIDGSFACYRGKYAKRLFPRIYRHTRVCMCFYFGRRTGKLLSSNSELLWASVKREAKIRSLASLADLPLLKN